MNENSESACECKDPNRRRREDKSRQDESIVLMGKHNQTVDAASFFTNGNYTLLFEGRLV